MHPRFDAYRFEMKVAAACTNRRYISASLAMGRYYEGIALAVTPSVLSATARAFLSILFNHIYHNKQTCNCIALDKYHENSQSEIGWSFVKWRHCSGCHPQGLKCDSQSRLADVLCQIFKEHLVSCTCFRVKNSLSERIYCIEYDSEYITARDLMKQLKLSLSLKWMNSQSVKTLRAKCLMSWMGILLHAPSSAAFLVFV